MQTLLLVRADFEGFQCARTITLLANQRGDLYCAVSCWKVAARHAAAAAAASAGQFSTASQGAAVNAAPPVPELLTNKSLLAAWIVGTPRSPAAVAAIV